MILTRLWAVILAVLATACLAGMFMLSAGASGDFDDSDRESLRAITEAGVAALDAEIQMTPARLASRLGEDEQIQKAIARFAAEQDPAPADEETTDEEDEDSAEADVPLPLVVEERTEAHRSEYDSNTTLAVVDLTGKVVASNGVIAHAMEELVTSDAYKEVGAGESRLFAAHLDGDLYVANVMAANDAGYRLVGTEPIDVGAGSILRRVLGAKQPAALVRKGKIIGGIMGDQNLSEEIKKLAAEHTADAPVTGASRVFTVGDGLNRRIGAIGRLPGPSGSGPNGVVLVVISRSTAAAGQQDLGSALRRAQEKGVRLNWALLGSVLAISLALAIYLPSLEAAGPIRRLTAEFQAVSTGTQHQIFHDRYGGAAGQLARTAAGTIEALRQAFLAELEIDEDDVGEPDAARPKPRTNRARRLTRGHERLKQAVDEVVNNPQPKSATAPAPTVPPSAIPEPGTAEPVQVPESTHTPEPARMPDPDPEPVTQVLTDPTPAQPETVSEPPAQPDKEVSHTVPMPRRQPAIPPPNFGKPAAPPAKPSTGPPPAPSPATKPAPKPAAAPPPPAPPRPRVPAPGTTADVSRPGDPEEHYREIFEQFIQIKTDCGEPTQNLSYERFAAKLRKNARDLKASRPDIVDVKFTVYIKDGKAALKAKVVR